MPETQKEIREQHKQKIDSARSEVVSQLRDEMHTLEENVLLNVSLFLGEDQVDKILDNYLTNTGIVDAIKDKILGTALKRVLSGDQESGAEGLVLYNKIEKARESLLALDRGKAKKDFTQKLNNFRKEFALDDDVVVDDHDFYQDDETYIAEKIDISGKKQLLFASISSNPYATNPKTGVTQCSYTARLNANNFNVDVPSGNAFDAKDKTPTDSTFISSVDFSDKDKLSINSVIGSYNDKANAADVYVYSSGRYAKYGHRCFMFKNVSDGKWYILDPYRPPHAASKKNPSNKESLAPKLLDEYIAHNKIAKVNFYNSPVAVVNENIEQTVA